MKWLVLIFSFVLNILPLFAQSSLQDIKLLSQQGIVIHFDVVPTTIISNLSEDKTQISIEFQKVSRNTPQKTYSFLSSIVRECSIEEKDVSCIVRIQMNSKNGYTISNLSFSNSLYVEFFQWDKLTQSEDVYRTGLLSLSEKLPDVAKQYFDSAYAMGNTEVNAIVAIENLNKKNYAYALEHSLRAIEKKSLHPDNFAIVSLLLKNHSDEVSSLFNKQYTFLTGLSSIQYGNEIGKFRIPIELDSLAARLARSFDTTKVVSQNDTSKTSIAKNDTLPQIVTKIPRPAVQAYKPTTQTIVLGSLVLLIIVGIIVFRKNLFPKKQPIVDNSIEEQAEEESSNIGVHFDEILKDENEMLTEYSEVSQENVVKEESIVKESNEEKNTIPPEIVEAIEEAKKAEEVKKAIGQFHNQQDDLLLGIQEIDPKSLMAIKGKIDFAENLKEQIQQKKDETISNLKEIELPTESFQISSKAKELGVEKEVLDIEKSLQDLDQDEETKQSLKKKFL
jgi:hypothetical protein